ncbi:MAG: HAD-IA family hydrolase [Hyphomicrobium sp.]
MNLVIFDCDGTLVDSQYMIVAAMAGAFAAHGLPPPPDEQVRRVIGLSLEGAVARLLPAGLHRQAPVIAEDYKASFRALRTAGIIEEPLYPGVHAAIEALAARDDVVLAIATGKSRRGVDAVLAREGLSRHFVSIQTADEHPSKPDPSMIVTAMAETGVDRGRTMMIGDTTFDIEMAVNAGVTGIGIGWGYHAPEELLAAGAVHLIHASQELGRALDALLARPGVAA